MCSHYRYENQSWNTQQPCKNPGVVMCAFSPSTGEAETRRPWGLLKMYLFREGFWRWLRHQSLGDPKTILKVLPLSYNTSSKSDLHKKFLHGGQQGNKPCRPGAPCSGMDALWLGWLTCWRCFKALEAKGSDGSHDAEGHRVGPAFFIAEHSQEPWL